MARFRAAAFATGIIIMTAFTGAYPEEASGMKGKERCSLWIDVLKGEPVSFGDMIKDIASVRVIHIGETHTIERHHLIQEQIVRALCGSGKKVLLGLEQMEAYNQEHLDRFNEGTIDFDVLAAKTAWEQRWSNYRDYRKVIETARECGGRVVALNARLETVRAVARDGLDAAKKTVGDLPELVFYPDESYAALLRKVMNVHGFMHHPAMLENMVAAQMVRDEAMAQNIKLYLEKEEYREYTAVVLTGSGHVSFGMGIPDRLHKRMPGIKDRIVLLSESGDLRLSSRQRAMARDIELSHEDMKAVGRSLADYLHVTEHAAQ